MNCCLWWYLALKGKKLHLNLSNLKKYIYLPIFSGLTQDTLLKCYECSLSTGSDGQKANICFSKEKNISITPPPIVQCGEGQQCKSYTKSDDQPDGSVLKVIEILTCVDNSKVPQESELFDGCKTSLKGNSQETECYCKENLCNGDLPLPPSDPPILIIVIVIIIVIAAVAVGGFFFWRKSQRQSIPLDEP